MADLERILRNLKIHLMDIRYNLFLLNPFGIAAMNTEVWFNGESVERFKRDELLAAFEKMCPPPLDYVTSVSDSDPEDNLILPNKHQSHKQLKKQDLQTRIGRLQEIRPAIKRQRRKCD